ncbi:leucine-rich repeat protein [Ruminococcus sp.]|uniref:leucine-rich repeat protein n=1 Tax=Ruminococcus sp. TaxID=41978 RepID=UPI00386FC7AA
MKKIIYPIITILLIVLIVFSAIGTANAETVYYYDGFLYTFINNDKVSLYGVEENMTDVVVPDTLNGRMVVDILNRAFMNNNKITSLDLTNAEHLERIGTFAFWNCPNLSGSLTLPASITKMETAAFQDCTSLESVAIMTTDSNVTNQCFYGCTSLSTVTIGENITRIGYLAFANCPNLTYVEIPAGVTVIESTAFDGDSITLGVYTDSAAHQFAVNNDIPFILLDAPVPPTEPPTDAPTEPITPTEEPTAEPTQQPTQPVTEAPTEAAVFILGDANGDNNVDVTDATIMQRYLANMHYIDEKVIMHGDVDGDGEISIQDVTFTLRYLACIEIPYPIDQPTHNTQ